MKNSIRYDFLDFFSAYFCYDTLYQTASKFCKIQAYIAYQKGPTIVLHLIDFFFQIATLLLPYW